MFGTKYYEVIQLENDAEEYCWAVRHTAYGTIEHKTFSLPTAIMVCRSLTDQLNDQLGGTGPRLTLVDETIN